MLIRLKYGLFTAAALLTVLNGCGEPAKNAPAKTETVKPKPKKTAISTEKSVKGAELDAMLADPKVGDFYAIDANKFLAEYGGLTQEEAAEAAFGILHVTKVTDSMVDVDSYTEVFSEQLNLDESLGNGTLTDMTKYDNDPDSLFRSRITDWGKKGIVTSALRKT